MTPMQKAFALVEAISRALANGIVHTNKAGERLTTVHEVLRCIRDEGEVTLEAGPTDYDLANLGESVVKDDPSLATKVAHSGGPTGPTGPDCGPQSLGPLGSPGKS
jgi:hypothetical protein